MSDMDLAQSQIEDEVVHLRIVNTELKADLQMTKRALVTAQSGPAPAAGIAPDRSAKIPDPPSFSKGRKEYRAFKNKLQHKLEGDAHLFRNACHQLTYAAGFVTDEAYEAINSLLPEMQSVADLIAHLDSIYEDPDRLGTADREMRTLTQGSTDFSSHYAKFQGIMAVLRWEGTAKQSALYNSLSYELKEVLARTIPVPNESFAQFVAKLRLVDDQLRRLAAENSGKGKATPTGKTAPRQTQSSSSSSNYSANPADSTGSTSHKGAAPMDLSAQRRLEAKQAQYAKWAEEGACTKCGDLKHWRKDCPKKQNRPLRAAGTADPATDASATDAPTTEASGKE
jgi:hypothetical protein